MVSMNVRGPGFKSRLSPSFCFLFVFWFDLGCSYFSCLLHRKSQVTQVDGPICVKFAWKAAKSDVPSVFFPVERACLQTAPASVIAACLLPGPWGSGRPPAFRDHLPMPSVLRGRQFLSVCILFTFPTFQALRPYFVVFFTFGATSSVVDVLINSAIFQTTPIYPMFRPRPPSLKGDVLP